MKIKQQNSLSKTGEIGQSTNGNIQTTIFQLQKIIRDELVEQSKNEGIEVNERVVTGKELLVQLTKKLQEETYELLQTKDIPQQISELIDIQELVDTLHKKLYYSKEQFIREVGYLSIDYSSFNIQELGELLQNKIHLLYIHFNNLEVHDKEYENIPQILFCLQKIIDTFLTKYLLSKEVFERKVATKKEKKGGFDKGVYVEREKVPLNHWLHAYYSKEPTRFPIIQENNIVSIDSDSEM